MTFAVATMDLVLPFLSSSSLQHNHNSKNQIVYIDFDGEFSNQGTCKGQFAPKPKWEAHYRNVNTICREGPLKEALDEPGISHYSDVYASLLQAATDHKALQQVHAHMFRSGLGGNPFLGMELVRMYSMCGSMENARLVFNKLCTLNVFLWNVMLRGYATNGLYKEALELYCQMQRAGIRPDKFTFPVVLKACAGLSAVQEGKEIHDHIVKTGFESDVFVGTGLIDMYAKCNSINNARQVLDKMSTRDVVSWSAMIAGYAQTGNASEALSLFHQMQLAGLKPNPVTMVNVLQACAHLGALQHGKSIHDYIIRSGFESDVVVGNSLIDMYVKCRRTDIARLLFEKLPKRNVVSWNTMIASYTHNGRANEALTLFLEMQLADVAPNSITMMNVLSACAHLTTLQQGRCIHGYVIRKGFESDLSVVNCLIDMYGKCGSVERARQLLDKTSKRDVVSWSAMIAGYAQNGHAKEALSLFLQMQLEDVTPNSITMVNVLPACAHVAALPQGKLIHGYIIKSGFESDVVGTSLIDMYAKCGRMEFAHQVFDKMSKRDVVLWNAMIAGYAGNGFSEEALRLFHQMQVVHVKPNLVTMVSVLPACAQLATLQQGKSIHGCIIRNGFESDVSVGTALIDMYAKCGSIENARVLFDKMSKRNVISWSAIIAGYGMHGHGEEALALFSEMQRTGVKPDHITFLSVLSACSHAGLVDEGWKYFNCMSQDYCLTPWVEHYACMVDLLGRSGHLDEAQDTIKRMPLEPGVSVWGALLAACRIHCNIQVAECVAENLFNLDLENAGYYVLLSNIYAAAGRWDDVAKVRTLMKERGLKKTPGRTLIEVNNRVHAFFMGDRSHPQSERIYAMLETLSKQMKELGYMPDLNFVLHDVEEEAREHMLGSHSEKLAIAFGLINTKPGTPIRITKNLRVCGDCHSATKFISKIVRRKIIVRDANRFHHFTDGLCSCGDYW